MSRVLIEYEKDDNTSATNNSSMLCLLSDNRIQIRIKKLSELTSCDIKWCDVYIACRPSSPVSLRIAKAVKCSGRFYVCFFDDDLIDRKQKDVLKLRPRSASACLEYADALMVSNPIIADEYSGRIKSKRFIVIDQTVDEHDIVSPSKVVQKTRIVYAAGKDHAVLFERNIGPVISSLFEKYHDKLSLTFVGVEPKMSNESIEQYDIQYIPVMPFAEYRAYMASANFHIGLAPLVDDSFSNRKYYNKFFEYSMAGIAGVYSGCLPYTLVIKNKVNGFLVEDKLEDWYKSLCKLIDNENVRFECVQNAQEQLRKQFDIEGQKNRLIKALPELVNSNCLKSDVINISNIKLKYQVFDIYEKIIKAIRYINRDGIKGLLCKYKDYRINRNTFRRKI